MKYIRCLSVVMMLTMICQAKVYRTVESFFPAQSGPLQAILSSGGTPSVTPPALIAGSYTGEVIAVSSTTWSHALIATVNSGDLLTVASGTNNGGTTSITAQTGSGCPTAYTSWVAGPVTNTYSNYNLQVYHASAAGTGACTVTFTSTVTQTNPSASSVEFGPVAGLDGTEVGVACGNFASPCTVTSGSATTHANDCVLVSSWNSDNATTYVPTTGSVPASGSWSSNLLPTSGVGYSNFNYVCSVGSGVTPSLVATISTAVSVAQDMLVMHN